MRARALRFGFFFFLQYRASCMTKFSSILLPIKDGEETSARSLTRMNASNKAKERYSRLESGFSFSLSPSTHIFLACSPSSISLCRIIIIPSASFFKNRNRTFFLFYFSYSFSLSLSVPPRFITRARTFTFFHLKRGRKKKRVVRCLGYNLVRSAETDRRFFFSMCV